MPAGPKGDEDRNPGKSTKLSQPINYRIQRENPCSKIMMRNRPRLKPCILMREESPQVYKSSFSRPIRNSSFPKLPMITQSFHFWQPVLSIRISFVMVNVVTYKFVGKCYLIF